ncbi:hypothetical protein O4H51_21090 [Aeromonas hydrophila]|uniref:hypothetical protein n=1 Tax=Aeromonas hydrophila TaxID=644 RepID=UPI0022AE6074|nr:hypothetical protein [Aeromonas hydrophila]MCZ4335357.1 hypothetical protein [Aeromonas hydrophila]
MAKHITIIVPGKHPQTGEITTFELKGQRMDINISGQTVPFLIHGRGIGTSLTHIPERLSHRAARWLAHCSLRNT